MCQLGQEVREKHFQKRRTRELLRLWQRRESILQLWAEASISVRGSLRKRGQRKRIPLRKPQKRASGAGRKSALSIIYEKVEFSFNRWRASGHYCDKNDLLQEFQYHCTQYLKGIEAKMARGEAVSGGEHRTKRAIQQRQRAHQKRLANVEYSKDHMARLFSARLLKPQRLISLSLDEERRRCHESWHMFDCALQLACFSPLPELGEHVLQPERFREQLRQHGCIVMSDQIPFFVKIAPGKQLYAPWEVVSKSSSGTMRTVRSSPISEDVQGMHQLRGEASGNQDKYRVTVDVEQVLRNYFSEEAEPISEWGLTSVIFPGCHLRMSNVSDSDTWLQDEVFTYNGQQVVRKAGEKLHPSLGAPFRRLRDEAPEFWAELKAAGIRLYQQPAGFEDTVISCWKVQAQAEVYPCSVAVRDMFNAPLSEDCRDMMRLHQQIPSWVRGKMTAAIQCTDTHIAARMKAQCRHEHAKLRRELIRLAELEDCRAVFRCGPYEVLRTLLATVGAMREICITEETILKSMRANGWLAIRPKLSEGRFIRCEEEDWAKKYEFRSHRLKRSWCEGRYDWIKPPQNIPEPLEIGTLEQEQCYHGPEGAEVKLSTWRKMAEAGELSHEQLSEMCKEPWLHIELQNQILAFEGLDEYKELLKSPAQLRKERGIDPMLSSQKPDEEVKRRRAQKLSTWRRLRTTVRTEALSRMRALKAAGYSVSQISSAVIQPSVGKGATQKRKDKTKDKLVKRLWAGVKKKLQKVGDHEGMSEYEKTYMRQWVRVEHEDRGFEQHFSTWGQCGKACETTQKVYIQGPETIVVVPAKLVVVRTHGMFSVRPLSGFKSVSKLERISLLLRAGVWDVEASAPLEAPAKKSVRLEAEHVKHWGVLLSWTFPEASVRMYEPDLYLRNLLSADLPTEDKERLQSGLRMSFKKFSVHLFPLHCEVSTEHPSGHWTLLVVERAQEGPARVRYYETLDKMNEVCEKKAREVLSVLGLPEEVQRSNEFRQVGDECTEWVMHYMELEVRAAGGEGRATKPGISPKRIAEIRQQLSGYMSNLEKTRLQWLKEYQEEQKLLSAMTEAWAAKGKKRDERVATLKSLSQLSSHVSRENMWEGEGLPNFELPEMVKTVARRVSEPQISLEEDLAVLVGLEGHSGGSLRC